MRFPGTLARTALLAPALLALAMALASCGQHAERPEGFSLVSYNLMTLFDPVDQGGEYPEFSVADGNWDEKAYRKRVASLASLVLAVAPGGPDILVVQEAENLRVLQDLAEALGGYRTIARSPDEEAALACGVLSRFPLRAMRSHRATPPAGSQSSAARSLLEVELDLDGHPLVVLAAHWKSKLGGARETEPERRAAAGLARRIIAARLAERPGLALVMAGDLNESPDEFRRVGGVYPTALALVGPGAEDASRLSPDRLAVAYGRREAGGGSLPVLYSPWEEFGGYSYLFQGRPERIDNLLLSPGLVSETEGSLRFRSFSAEPPEFAVDDSGAPVAWSARRGGGYSDHLPVMAEFTLAP